MDEPDREPRSTDADAAEHIDDPAARPAPHRSGDGAMTDGVDDPAFRAVVEAGGGTAEGFEQSEAALVENAEAADPRGLDRIIEDAGAPEDPPHDEHGEADRPRVPEPGEEE
ncbi:MAG: hypothetical protein RIB67_01115 [Miltoncostaeaceae bacterium]